MQSSSTAASDTNSSRYSQGGSWSHFSKVSSLFHLQYQITFLLTFENIYQQSAMVGRRRRTCSALLRSGHFGMLSHGTATHCNTLKHTATHCNTMQHAARTAEDSPMNESCHACMSLVTYERVMSRMNTCASQVQRPLV